MPGPPRKPTNLVTIEGNRGKRGLNKQEPDPEYLPADSLAAPSWLDQDAAAAWDEIAPLLQKAKLVARIDVQLLAMGCVAVGDFRFAVKKGTELKLALDLAEKNKNEADKTSLHGKIQFWSVQQSMAYKQATQILRDFGVSPAARTRIALQAQLPLFGDEHGEAEKQKKYFG